jgi:hypothetical protein
VQLPGNTTTFLTAIFLSSILSGISSNSIPLDTITQFNLVPKYSRYSCIISNVFISSSISLVATDIPFARTSDLL